MSHKNVLTGSCARKALYRLSWFVHRLRNVLPGARAFTVTFLIASTLGIYFFLLLLFLLYRTTTFDKHINNFSYLE
jgi:hypothetical protein